MKNTTILMILDGWGYNPDSLGNAVMAAKTPNLDRIIEKYPGTLIKCSGEDVGLPKGFMGNSEVGHLNIGAGRVVYQDLTRIDKAIEEGDFFKNEELLKAFKLAKSKGSRIHFMGLLSDGGVHSHINHLEALIKMSSERDFSDVFIHTIFDGRDTEPKIADRFLTKLISITKQYGVGSIASMSGRYYAMDRDRRWDRVKKAYDAMVRAVPKSDMGPIEYINKSHSDNIGDEFIVPACFDASGIMKEGDVVIFYNFRADRARQITRSLTDKNFDEFDIKNRPELGLFVCMTEYDKGMSLPVAFGKQEIKNIFGEVISQNGLKQLRIAETEKYAHVTFFFNGGNEVAFDNEDRILIDSPRDVPTYDLKPQMSAFELTDRLLKELKKSYYDLIVVNYANCDMVGHTGVFEAAVKAVEAVDSCVGKIYDFIDKNGGAIFLTADHGNAEKMVNGDGGPHTAHTTDDVRFLLISKDVKKDNASLKPGRLSDIMPTILNFMGLDLPKEVTGVNLLRRDK